MTGQVLPGPWWLRVVGEREWRPAAAPGSWETAGIAKDFPGPVEYRTEFSVPPDLADSRVVLRFGAVSYGCDILVNGMAVGRHVGMWDAFEVDVTDAVNSGSGNELTVVVEKPAGLTAGPDSDPVPGRYPVTETLAGFLPYV